MKKILIPIFSAMLLCFTSCDKESLPLLTEVAISDITANSVNCFVVVSMGNVDDCGFYYGTSKLSVTNNKGTRVQTTCDSQSFGTVIAGLTPNTTYYIKGYAMNEKGEATTGVVEVKTLVNLPGASDNQYPEVSK